MADSDDDWGTWKSDRAKAVTLGEGSDSDANCSKVQGQTEKMEYADLEPLPPGWKLYSLTVKQFKKLLSTRGSASTGNKEALVRRLLAVHYKDEKIETQEEMDQWPQPVETESGLSLPKCDRASLIPGADWCAVCGCPPWGLAKKPKVVDDGDGGEDPASGP